MNRITLEEVQVAYVKHNIKPGRGRLYLRINGEIECCAVGVIAYDIIGDKIADIGEAMNVLSPKYGREYLYGVVCGFDNISPSRNNAEYLQGVEDGKKIAAAVFAK